MYAEPSPMALLRWGSDDQTSDDGEALFCADLNGTSRKESDCENTLRCFTEWFAGGEAVADVEKEGRSSWEIPQ